MGSGNTLTRVSDELLKKGIFRSGINTEGGAFVPIWSSVCSRCEKQEEHQVKAGVPAETVIRKFQNWSLGKKPLCPTCFGGAPVTIVQPADALPATPAAITLAQITQEKAPLPTPPTAGAQVKNILRVSQKLDEVWVSAGDRIGYASGWDDARVAKETGVSIDIVMSVREEQCGPLLDPEVAGMKSELDAILAMVDDLRKRIMAFEIRRKVA